MLPYIQIYNLLSLSLFILATFYLFQTFVKALWIITPLSHLDRKWIHQPLWPKYPFDETISLHFYCGFQTHSWILLLYSTWPEWLVLLCFVLFLIFRGQEETWVCRGHRRRAVPCSSTRSSESTSRQSPWRQRPRPTLSTRTWLLTSETTQSRSPPGLSKSTTDKHSTAI